MNTFMTLSNANSVESVVDFINTVNDRKDHLVDHYGWGDVAEQYELNDYAAAQYAYESSEDKSMESVEANLDFIKDEGAQFNSDEALKIAKLFLEQA